MKILVCDDNQMIVNEIIEKIKKYTPKGVVATITGLSQIEDITYNIQHYSYDIAFLDIEILSLNGIKVGAAIQKKNPYCILIFVSGYAQYVTDAFSIKAFQYLYKPIDPERFKKEYHKAIQFYQRVKATCEFNTLEGKTIFQPRDIMYVETYYRRIKIVTSHDTFLCSIKNKHHIIETLKNHDFIQIHQSYYVNMNHIYVAHSDYVTLFNHKQLPISCAKREEVKNKFHTFLINQTFHDYPDFD